MDYFDYVNEKEFEEFTLTIPMVHYLSENLFGSECSDVWRILTANTTVEGVKRSFNAVMSIMELPLTEDWDEVSQLKAFIFREKVLFMARLVIEKIIKGELTVTPTARTGISDLVRKDVLSAGKCAFCNSTENLQVDHIIPLEKGGTNNRANLQCLCERCNKSKNCKYESEIIADLKRQLTNLQNNV